MTTGARPLVLVAPSGTGKTTVAQELVRLHPDRFTFSVSATTRPPRAGEVDGRDYHFVTEDAFKALIADGKLAEWAQVHGRYYGTPFASLDPALLGGRTPVLDIDVAGAEQVQAQIPDATVIFLLPPGPEAWIDRLVGRATETPEQLRVRLETALAELERAPEFEEFVVNEILGETVEEILGVLDRVPSAGISSLRAETLCGALRDGATSWVGRMTTDVPVPEETEC